MDKIPEFHINMRDYDGKLVGEAAEDIINKLIAHYNKYIVNAPKHPIDKEVKEDL